MSPGGDELEALLESAQLLEEAEQSREETGALHPKPEIDRAIRRLLRGVVGDNSFASSDDPSIELSLPLSDIRQLVEELTGIAFELALEQFVAGHDDGGAPTGDDSL